MENSFSPYGFRCSEITAEQILCHCAFIITAVGGPKCFIDFVIESAPRTPRRYTCETRLRPHTNEALRYHVAGCASVEAIAIAQAKDFVLTLWEYSGLPRLGDSRGTRRKTRPLEATDVPNGSHPKEVVRIDSNVALENPTHAP